MSQFGSLVNENNFHIEMLYSFAKLIEQYAMVNIKYYYNYTSQKCNFDLEESHFLRYKKRDNLFQKLLPN